MACHDPLAAGKIWLAEKKLPGRLIARAWGCRCVYGARYWISSSWGREEIFAVYSYRQSLGYCEKKTGAKLPFSLSGVGLSLWIFDTAAVYNSKGFPLFYRQPRHEWKGGGGAEPPSTLQFTLTLVYLLCCILLPIWPAWKCCRIGFGSKSLNFTNFAKMGAKCSSTRSQVNQWM